MQRVYHDLRLAVLFDQCLHGLYIITLQFVVNVNQRGRDCPPAGHSPGSVGVAAFRDRSRRLLECTVCDGWGLTPAVAIHPLAMNELMLN